MKLDKIKLKLTKYTFSTFQLIIGKTKHDVPNINILGFSIIHDFDSYFFPYFEVKLSIPNKIYRKMGNRGINMKANVELQKGTMKEAISVDNDKLPTFKKVFNQQFHVEFIDGAPDLTEDVQKIAEKSSNKYGQLTTLSILLYPLKYYNKFNLVINNVLTNVTLLDALTFCLNKAGIDNVLLSPPSSSKKYKQFVITPVQLVEQIDRICNTYGMHSKGTLFYFNFTECYIIDQIPQCTAWKAGENKIVYVIASESINSGMISGGSVNNKDGYFVINASNILSTNNSERVEKISGSNIVTISNSDTVTKTIVDSSKVNRVVVQDEGEGTAKALKKSVIETKRVVNASFTDIDIDALKPNKQFILTFDNAKFKKYKGKYRLAKVSNTFLKEGDYFSVTSSAEFRG